MQHAETNAGGVGLQTLRILQRQPGCSALGLVGSEDKAAFLSSLFPREAASGRFAFQARASGASAFASQLAAYLGGSINGQKGLNAPGPSSAAAPSADASDSNADADAGINPGGGFDLVFDSVAGEYFHPSFSALKPMGRHVIFGAAALTPPPGANLTLGLHLLWPPNFWSVAKLVYGFLTRPKVDVIKLPGDNKSVMGFNLIWLYDRLPEMRRMLDRLQVSVLA